ncbi:MAG: retroviral-like aspartic protease family protein [Pseudomonadota bacterium]
MTRVLVLLALVLTAQAPPPEEATLVYLPRDERMTVPVAVDGSGSHRFVIDTGAQRSVIARELAATLALPPGRPVRLVSMTGVTTVPTARIGTLTVGPLGALAIEAPVLAQAALGAPGMLGIDALQGHALSIDFRRRSMTVRPAQKRPPRLAADEAEVVVTAKSFFGQLVVTDAYYRTHRIRVVIDTGTPISLGNPALQRLVARRQELTRIRIQDVAGGELHADYGQIAEIAIGGVTLQNLPIAFADAAPFRSFRLTEVPALLLGMDALALFARIDVDFDNRKIRFVRTLN